jgi:primosomal protein N' (replication factor Y)
MKLGKYRLLELNERINGVKMPEVELVDMRQELLLGNRSIFSGRLYEDMAECIESGKQAILFINRRGYSTFISCRGCGYVFRCSRCDVSLNFHKSENVMKCHYCGMQQSVPVVCPECGKPYIKYFGVATQQVEEQVKKLFPSVKVLRMDFDTTRTKDAHVNIYNKFRTARRRFLSARR